MNFARPLHQHCNSRPEASLTDHVLLRRAGSQLARLPHDPRHHEYDEHAAHHAERRAHRVLSRAPARVRALRVAHALLVVRRAQHVLDCIFSDEKVREALGAAGQFKGIADPDAVPGGVLTKLKAGPGKHIKDRYYKYVKALKTEIAHIERLQMLQKQATGLIFLGLLAMGTGVGNFVVGLFANKLYYDEWVPDLRSDARPAPASE